MKFQRGGFFLGMIIGMLLGLGIALGVALYITKVPLPFIDKVPQRTPEQNAAEAEHNKNWDPNSPLYGRNPAKPHAVEAASAASDAASGAALDTAPAGSEVPVVPAPVASAASVSGAAKGPGAAASSVRDPAAILAGQPVSSAPAADSLSFQVQAGAYGSQAEAEQQRAKLAMMGLEAHIQERDVNGRTMYRVRIGPFAQRDAAEEIRVRLQGAGIDSALVRVQK